MICLLISADELNAIIDFQRVMRTCAMNSCEHMEALERRARITQLEAIAAKAKPAAKAGDNAKIIILEKGKKNPRKRRRGGGPWQRYEDVLQSETVADFLKKQPKWRATLNRAVKEGLIRIEE
jgi:hypothetical protein